MQNIYWIESAKPHRIAIVARPRGNDWLEDEAAALSRDGIEVLVSALTPDETEELGLVDEERLCNRHGIRFFNIAIPDRCVPDEDAVTGLLDFVMEHVKDGRGVGFHCRAGIGRSSMLAALTLCRLGWEPEAAFRAIEEARGCRVPDTLEQEQWVYRFVRKVRS